MRRARVILCVMMLLAAARAPAQETGYATTARRPHAGLVSVCQDPNCAGCRAFLAGYSAGPSCSCENDSSGKGGGAGGGAGMDEAFGPYADNGLGEELYAGDAGSGYGYGSAAPNMIGDFFGGGYQLGTFTDMHGPGIPIAAGDRRFKVSDNVSPFPRDRVYFSYNHFYNSVFTVGGRELDVRRYTFGIEKTFLDEMASIEVRAPFAYGLAANQTSDGNDGNDSDTQFGNITIAPKIALAASDRYLLSTGVGVNLPTAQDGSIDTLVIENEAVHLMPFLGLLLTPNEYWYVISYVQANFDCNGYTIIDSGTVLGQLQEQALLSLDLAVGRWIFRDEGARLSGIAPQIEIHYTTTMQDPDAVGGFFNPAFRTDALSLTGGLNFQFFNTSTLTIAGVAPLRGDKDVQERPYDAELQVYFNRAF